jgi:hypothetical protein
MSIVLWLKLALGDYPVVGFAADWVFPILDEAEEKEKRGEEKRRQRRTKELKGNRK